MTAYIRKMSQHHLPIGRLKHLDIELTERCNNNCIHCCINKPANDVNALGREMPLGTIKNILKEAADLGCLTVRFTGGEPLLRQDFATLYEFTRRLGMRVQLFTNARLITLELANLFVKIPPMEKIEVTVYGMNEQSYTANSLAPAGFKSYTAGLQLLLDHHIPFVVKSVLLPANQRELEAFEAYANNLPWSEGNPMVTMFYDLRNRRDDLQKNRQISSLRIPPEEGVSYLLRHEAEWQEYRNSYRNLVPPIDGSRLFQCSAGKNQLCVDAYGQVQACMGLRAPELVCQTGTSLSEALDFFKQLPEIRTDNPDYLNRCGRCLLRNLCDQCPAKSWTESGKLDVPVQYLCDITHELGRSLGLLKPGQLAWEINT